jgi:hypothetical protein
MARIKRTIEEQETTIKVNGTDVGAEPSHNEDDMTEEELAEYLNSVIRRTARWTVKSQEVPYLTSDNQDLLDRVSGRVYDNLVNEYSWNRMLLKATRAVDFSKEYVRRTIRQGLYSGILEIGLEGVKEAEALLEGKLGTDDMGEAVKRLVNVVAREEVRR